MAGAGLVMGWQVSETEGGGQMHVPFADEVDAYTYLHARVTRWWGAGWMISGFQERPYVKVTLTKGKLRKVVEAKRLVT